MIAKKNRLLGLALPFDHTLSPVAIALREGYRRRRWAVVNPMKAQRIMGYRGINKLHLEEVAAVKASG